MNINMNLLRELYFKSKGTYPNHIEPLSGAGSNRKYYRIIPSKDSEPSCIGVVGTSAEENLAFCHLSQLFISKHLPVPAVCKITSFDRLATLEHRRWMVEKMVVTIVTRKKHSLNK